MSDAIGWAAQRMTAIRFEEQKLWPEAAEAWHRAIAAVKEEGRHVTLVGQRLLTEMEARASHAITRATHPGLEEPIADIEGRIQADAKPADDRLPVPGAAERGEAGRVTQDAGAR